MPRVGKKLKTKPTQINPKCSSKQSKRANLLPQSAMGLFSDSTGKSGQNPRGNHCSEHTKVSHWISVSENKPLHSPKAPDLQLDKWTRTRVLQGQGLELHWRRNPELGPCLQLLLVRTLGGQSHGRTHTVYIQTVRQSWHAGKTPSSACRSIH